MPSRHQLLAELEDRRRENEEDGVEVLDWDLAESPDLSGHNPYDNPGAGKIPPQGGVQRKVGRKSG